MIFIIPEGRHKIIIGESGWVNIVGRFATVFDSGNFSPVVGVVSKDGAVVVGDAEINFENTMSELVVQEESFVGVSIGVAVDTTESVSNVRRFFNPVVVEIVWKTSVCCVSFGSFSGIRVRIIME